VEARSDGERRGFYPCSYTCFRACGRRVRIKEGFRGLHAYGDKKENKDKKGEKNTESR